MYFFFVSQMDDPSFHFARDRFCCAVNLPFTYLWCSWFQSFRHTEHTLGHFKLRWTGTNVVRKYYPDGLFPI